MTANPSVELLIIPPVHDLGDGFHVRRALPSSQRRAVGPFVFFDQMGPTVLRAGSGLDVRPHPHIGLATVTYLFDGEIIHRDSLGTVQAIRPGAVSCIPNGLRQINAAPVRPCPVSRHGSHCQKQRRSALRAFIITPPASCR